MKLCINCKHYKDGSCHAPQNTSVDIVTGVTTWPVDKCEYHRKGFGVGWLDCRINGYCGAEGRWFQPKEANV